MPKKNKIKKQTRKQKGGSIDINRKNTNYDDWMQYLSIALLIIALILGISVFMQRRKKPINNEKIIYRDRIIEKPINNDRNFYEEKIERRLEPPGVVYESDRYMPRYVESRTRHVPINIRTRGSPAEYQ